MEVIGHNTESVEFIIEHQFKIFYSDQQYLAVLRVTEYFVSIVCSGSYEVGRIFNIKSFYVAHNKVIHRVGEV